MDLQYVGPQTICSATHCTCRHLLLPCNVCMWGGGAGRGEWSLTTGDPRDKNTYAKNQQHDAHRGSHALATS